MASGRSKELSARPRRRSMCVSLVSYGSFKVGLQAVATCHSVIA